jgi:hypothetical protein
MVTNVFKEPADPAFYPEDWEGDSIGTFVTLYKSTYLHDASEEGGI